MKKEKKATISKAPVSPEYAGGAGLFFLFLFMALAIHFLLFLLFRPIPQELPSVKSDSKSRTILLLEDSPEYRRRIREYKLEYALEYLEPRKAVLPDLESGFSSILSRRDSLALLPEPLTRFPGKKASSGNSTFVLPERSLGELSPGLDHDSFSGKKGKKTEEAEVHLPHWKLGKNVVVRSWLVPEHASEEEFRKYAPLAKGPTILMAGALEEGLPPFVRIRTSCGVPALDQLAVRQLSLYLAKMPSSAFGKNWFFISVLWRLPELKGSQEVHK